MASDLIESTGLGMIAVGVLLIGFCLAVHSFAMFVILKSHTRFVRVFPNLHGATMLIASMLLATAFIAVSCLIQIVLWTALLWSTDEFSALRDAMYFSSTTFTTLGTSHIALRPPFRVLEPLEATNGMLANGLNTATLFALMTSLARRRSGYEEFFH